MVPSQYRFIEYDGLFVPGRLAQYPKLSQASYNIVQQIYHRIYRGAPNLSQFKINDFVADLLQDRLHQKYGAWEITLQTGSRFSLFNNNLIPTAVFQQVLGPMFLTEPPCMNLGIYSFSGQSLDRLTKIHDAEGIKFAQLARVLEQHYEDVVKSWQGEAGYMALAIRKPHWTVFTYPEQKRWAWCCRGIPKVVLFLEQTEDEITPLARDAYRYNNSSSSDYEREWL
jgi:hypothetical protein